jgi:hypothetical protein
MDRYPLQANALWKGKEQPTRDLKLDLLEYQDADEMVTVVMGCAGYTSQFANLGHGTAQQQELERSDNKAGIPLIVSPGRITLDGMMGQFNSILPILLGKAKMAAYEELSIFRSIFPEEWVVSHPNAMVKPKIVVVADAKMGRIGQIENGVLQTVTLQPSQQVMGAMDRLEREVRVGGGIPADLGGESGSNIRTARRGDAVMASTMDMPIAEYQDIFAQSFESEDVRAIAIMKAWYGPKATSFYIPRDGKIVKKDYTPDEAFDTDWHYVKFSMPGVDAAGIPIELGQRLGTGELSMQTAREIDPIIEDPIRERDQVEIEGLNKALLAGLEQRLQMPPEQGGMDPHEIALIAQIKAKSHKELYECVIDANEEMQKRNAAAQQNPPGPNEPEAQPGLGGAAPPGGPAPGGPPPLADLLQSLRSPTKESPAETQLAGATAG